MSRLASLGFVADGQLRAERGIAQQVRTEVTAEYAKRGAAMKGSSRKQILREIEAEIRNRVTSLCNRQSPPRGLY